MNFYPAIISCLAKPYFSVAVYCTNTRSRQYHSQILSEIESLKPLMESIRLEKVSNSKLTFSNGSTISFVYSEHGLIGMQMNMFFIDELATSKEIDALKVRERPYGTK